MPAQEKMPRFIDALAAKRWQRQRPRQHAPAELNRFMVHNDLLMAHMAALRIPLQRQAPKPAAVAAQERQDVTQ
jgi:hypothetical protein